MTNNKYCLFHIHPYKECNMEGTGKKCGFKHEYPPLKVLKECKKCMGSGYIAKWRM